MKKSGEKNEMKKNEKIINFQITYVGWVKISEFRVSQPKFGTDNQNFKAPMAVRV